MYVYIYISNLYIFQIYIYISNQESTHDRKNPAFVQDWLILLDMTISSLVDLPENDVISFFFLITKGKSIVYRSHIFFIHSSDDGHLIWFRILAIMSVAELNLDLQESME